MLKDCSNCINNEGYEDKKGCAIMREPGENFWCWTTLNKQIQQEKERYTYLYKRFANEVDRPPSYYNKLLRDVRHIINDLELRRDR